MKSRMNGVARAAWCAGVLATALLASCGGGQQVTTFVATRVVALGDENSLINSDGSKYTVNALLSGSTTAYDCSSNPLWIQSVAAIYGLYFPQCPGINGVDNVSRIYATNGAVVGDLSTQIDSLLNEGGVTGTDLVTVLVGGNDVLAQFAQYPTVGEDQLAANLDAAGTALADQVNRIASLGPKVLISTIPDMGLTPFAGDRSADSTDGNPALLSRLSARFNDALLAHLTNDGHKIGLIQLDQSLTAIDTNTRNAVGTFSNTTLPSCAVALPRCTTNTLVADAVNATWLWADNLHISASGQSVLASLATTRAQNNPF